MKYYLAIDIGASSGRAIIGYMENKELKLEEIYRFKNGVKDEDNHLIWDINNIFQNIIEGIKKSLEKYPHIESMGIDTWGVDYVLMNQDKEILPCFSYRDKRTKDYIPLVHDIISFNNLYKITGSQFQEFNTIYQLYCDKCLGRLDNATSFLHIPEYLMYKLTGKKCHEYTNASTTGLMDGETFSYSKEIINKLGLKEGLFTEPLRPRYVLGDFTKEIQEKVRGNIKVMLVPTHDTASAVCGIPMDDDSIYLSSGTWSLIGIKSKEIINTDKARIANFSNEYGPSYIRFQKNIMGLWIIQRLSQELNLDFKEMVDMAKTSNYQEIFDVNDERFLSSMKMKEEIINWFKDHHLDLPKDEKDIINSSYHSLAKSYQDAVIEIEDITKRKYNYLYIVGGGAKNEYLNELTRLYTGYNVKALPIEATSIGNILTQMKYGGDAHE